MMSSKVNKKAKKAKPKAKVTGANLSQLNAQATQYHQKGQYQKALQICLQVARSIPKNGEVWLDAGVNCVKLMKWDDAIVYSNRALLNGTKTFRLYDTLSHAYGKKKQWDKVKETGGRALQIRDQQFSKPVDAIPTIELPPKPSAQTRNKNIISFALFGGLSKYCETSVLNVQEQKQIYPNWTCRF